jgi:Methyltransferase domain
MQQSFYGSIRSNEYDIGTIQQPIYEFYLNRWRELGAPNPVLEPMCGTGLNLIPFLQAHADASGLDSSPHMLAICQRKCDELELKPHLYQQYLEAMNLPIHYGFIMIPGGSFGHLYDKAIAQVALHKMWEHLLPGGWLVLDARPPAYKHHFGEPGKSESYVDDHDDGSTIVCHSIWAERDGGRVTRHWNKYEQFADGKLIGTEIFDYNERMYERDELSDMLSMAGFDLIEVTKAYEEQIAPEGEDGIVFSARRPLLSYQ